MGATDEVHVVFLQESRYNVRAECEGDTSVVFTPSGNILIRIRPEQVAQQTTIRNLEYVSDARPGYSGNEHLHQLGA